MKEAFYCLQSYFTVSECLGEEGRHFQDWKTLISYSFLRERLDPQQTYLVPLGFDCDLPPQHKVGSPKNSSYQVCPLPIIFRASSQNRASGLDQCSPLSGCDLRLKQVFLGKSGSRKGSRNLFSFFRLWTGAPFGS